VRRRVTGEDVLGFLLLNADFPRSIMHCVAQLDTAAVALPHHQATRAKVAVLQAELAELDFLSLNYATVHRLVDELQLEFAAVDRTVFESWLDPVREN
jgi:uncharacterized alpha-E superfamily protein